MNQTYMKEKPILPLLLSMALPMVISMMVNSLYNIVDSYFVARISEEAMTALSLVYPIQNFITSVGVGFGIGINAAISFFLGAQDQKKADAAATQGLFLSVIHGIVLTVVTIAVMPLFLQIFTKDVTVIQMGNAYSRIAFGFSIVISLEITWEKIFQAVGRMRQIHKVYGLCAFAISVDYQIKCRTRLRHQRDELLAAAIRIIGVVIVHQRQIALRGQCAGGFICDGDNIFLHDFRQNRLFHRGSIALKGKSGNRNANAQHRRQQQCAEFLNHHFPYPPCRILRRLRTVQPGSGA